MRINLFMGTRPEVLKLAPVARALKEYAGEVETRILALGQHLHMLSEHLEEQELGYNDSIVFARPSGQTLAELTQELLIGATHLLDRIPCDLALVQGDTTSAMAAALACYYKNVPVGHVEAGLRTWKRNPFPEEMNRTAITELATLHFAPTEGSMINLDMWNLGRDNVFLTGNTSVDQLHYDLSRGGVPDGLDLTDKKVILVACHRREGVETFLPRLVHQVNMLATLDENLILWPAHPNPVVRAAMKDLDQRVRVLEPLSHASFVHLLARADAVLTDSGGVVEEATTLGVRCFVLREETERPEALSLPWVRLVPLDKMHMLAPLTVAAIHEWQTEPSAVFGDGNAGVRIAKLCVDYLQRTK